MKAHGKFSVLSAGDQETFSLLTALFGFLDIDVVGVGTVADTLQLAKLGGFAAHILGTRFSDGDGFELCRALKVEKPSVPTVFYTGDVLAGARRMGLKCGADAYLEKPYQGDIAAFVLALIRDGQQPHAGHPSILSSRTSNIGQEPEYLEVRTTVPMTLRAA